MDQLRRSYAVAVARRVIERCQKASETGVEQIPMAGLFMPMHPQVHAVPPLPRDAPQPQAFGSARWRLWMALDYLCGICGYPIETLEEVTYDHVIPRSRGGANYSNLVPAHGRCNGEKGDRMPYGCELIMLDALNAKAGNVVQALTGYTPLEINPAIAMALRKAGFHL